MATNQPVQQREDGHADNFELEFNQEINQVPVFRKGSERCPIERLQPRRFMRERDYVR